MKGMGISRVKAATVALVLAAVGAVSQVPHANATTTGCSPGGFCLDYSVFGDMNYTEVLLYGGYEGAARMALESLRLCDEKSDQVAATATITVAERRIFDGQVSYRQYPDQEYVRGPGAGCQTYNPPDYVAPTGKYIWAVRADYSYSKLFNFGVLARAQTYHTGWVYNWYLRDWCPTC